MDERLRAVRESAGMSLREFADFLEDEAGYEISHAAVREYERGRSVPARYLGALSEALGVDVDWMVTGRGPGPRHLRSLELEQGLRELADRAYALARKHDPSPGPDERLERTAEAWRRFVHRQPTGGGVADFLVRSWERSAAAGVDPEADPPDFRRVDGRELEERRRASADLVRAAEPHLHWLSASMARRPSAVYLTDADGIVLTASGRPEAVLDEWRLRPGSDWSEERMGTNGAGTALATGRPVAVIGPEHFGEAFHEVACTAAPVRGVDGEIVGVVDISTDLLGGGPGRLAVVSYVAAAVESGLAEE